MSLNNLKNSESRNLLLPYNDKRSIAHLTFDPEPGFAYWWNEKEQSIEMFDIATPDDVKTLVSDVRNVKGEGCRAVSVLYVRYIVLFSFRPSPLHKVHIVWDLFQPSCLGGSVADSQLLNAIQSGRGYTTACQWRYVCL